MKIHPSTLSKFSTQCLTAFALSAAIAVGTAAMASAEPTDGEWDIQAYDDCVQKAIDDTTATWGGYDINAIFMRCCIASGGNMTGPSDGVSCVAPPANRSPGGGTGPTTATKVSLVPKAPPPPLSVG
jgi:hypothetical protein